MILDNCFHFSPPASFTYMLYYKKESIEAQKNYFANKPSFSWTCSKIWLYGNKRTSQKSNIWDQRANIIY